MSRLANLYIPGILTFPGDASNWSGRAVTFTHALTGGERVAEKVEYFTTALLRPFGQQSRANKLARTWGFYNSKWWDVRLVGHSNGCDVICDVIRANPHFRASQIHLVCGACSADLESNGINETLRSSRVQEAFIYVAGRDKALRLAQTPIGQFLGYGTLGLKGPKNIDPQVARRVQVIEWPEYGHSDCWSDANFPATMRYFV